MAEDKKFTPLLPFDSSLGEQFALYDNMTYVCDNDICNAGMVKMESGNVCKFYRCKSTEPIKIGGDIVDSEALEIEEDSEENDISDEIPEEETETESE